MQIIKLLIRDKFIWLLCSAVLLGMALPLPVAYDQAARLFFNIAIFVIFLFHGIRLPRKEVRDGLANWRLQGAVFLWVFGAMLIAGWVLWQAFGTWLPGQVALGLLYIGVLPSTVQSATSYCTIARGNVSASVVASALLNLTGVVISPLLFAFLAHTSGIAISGEAILKIAVNLLLPFALGQVFQSRLQPIFAHYHDIIGWLDKSIIALAVYLALGSAVAAGLWQIIGAQELAVMIIAASLFLIFAFGGSWLLGGLMALPMADRLTLLFAGGHKSIAVGAPLAAITFPPQQAGLLLLPLVIYHLFQMFVSAPIAIKMAERSMI